jgi:cyclic pyranopterin phosphate synthase
MPPEGLALMDKSAYLTVDEIVRFARVIGRVGVGRIRLTGGEPLLRKDIVPIVGRLRQVESVNELSITTNGSRLTKLAEPLRSAGLDRLNISLDSLDPERFREIARFERYDRVRDGIRAALDVGFPVKLNVVVLKGMPESEILEFAEMAVASDLEVRFLEFMPLCGSGWQADLVLPIGQVRDVVRGCFNLHEEERGDRPAQTFSVEGGRGRVGFIASLSEPFCGTCSRVRLTADGKIRPCLFSEYEVALRDLMQPDVPDDRLLEAIKDAVSNKPWGNEFSDAPFEDGENTRRNVMSTPAIRSIGG